MLEIDHVLGRPSVKFRKIQVLAVVSFWSIYLYKYVKDLFDSSNDRKLVKSNNSIEATVMVHPSSAAYPPSSPDALLPGRHL